MQKIQFFLEKKVKADMDMLLNIQKTKLVCDSVIELRRLATVKAIGAAVASNSTTEAPSRLIAACSDILRQSKKIELQVDQHIPPLFSVRNLRITDLINDYSSGHSYSTGSFYLDTTLNVEGSYVNTEEAELFWRTGLLFELFPVINVFHETSLVNTKALLEYLRVLKEVTQDSDYQKKSGDFLDEETLVWANRVMIAFVEEIFEKFREDCYELYNFPSQRYSRTSFEVLLDVVSKFCLQENLPKNIADRLENVKATLSDFMKIPLGRSPSLGINEMRRFYPDTFGDLKRPPDCALGTQFSFFMTVFFGEMETKMEFPVSVSFVYRNIRLLETLGTSEYSAELGDFAVYPRDRDFCQRLANSNTIQDVSLNCIPIGGNSFVFQGPQLENLHSRTRDRNESVTWNLRSLVSTQDPLQSRTFSDSEIFEFVKNCRSQKEVEEFYYSLKDSVVKSIVSFVARNIKQKFIQNKNIKPKNIKRIISAVLYRQIKSACFHPHVNMVGVLCPGSTADDCKFFVQNKRFSGFGHLIKTLLKTHNMNSLMYSSTINMYSFFNGVCPNCNLFIADNDLVVLDETHYHRSCCIQLKDGTPVSSREASRCTSCGCFERKDLMKRISRGVFNCPECQTAKENA